jgi:uncharacterized membrane protein
MVVEAAVVLSLVALFVVSVSLFEPGLPRGVVALVALLFLPGYALTTALFPERAPSDGADDDGGDPDGDARRRGPPVHRLTSPAITDWERFVLSFGLSVALVPPMGLLMAAAGVPFTTLTVVFVVGGVIVVGLLFGVVRRARLATDERYTLPSDRLARRAQSAFAGDRVEVAVNLLLVVAAVSTLFAFTFAVVEPEVGSTYTQASLLTENEAGELVAGGYQSTFSGGDSGEYVLSLENHEGARVEYSVVVELQRLSEAGDPVETSTLRRLDVAVADGETRTVRHTLRPDRYGDRLRLTYLVYRGTPPEDPGTDSAYRTLTLWVEVTPPE